MWRTTGQSYLATDKARISIHVLRVEDDAWLSYCYVGASISIHVLRVEDDAKLLVLCWPLSDFNPRPPCGGRLWEPQTFDFAFVISIHVLRVEDDRKAQYNTA